MRPHLFRQSTLGARLQFPGKFVAQIQDMQDGAVLPKQLAMDSLQRRYTEPHQPFDRSGPVQHNVCRHGFNNMNVLCGWFIKLDQQISCRRKPLVSSVALERPMWSLQTALPLSQPIETKFFCLSTERKIGSLLDGWRVVWCQPDRLGIVWHIMVVRSEIRFRGCCG